MYESIEDHRLLKVGDIVFCASQPKVAAFLICLVVHIIARHRRGAQLAYLRGGGSSNTERAPAAVLGKDPATLSGPQLC